MIFQICQASSLLVAFVISHVASNPTNDDVYNTPYVEPVPDKDEGYDVYQLNPYEQRQKRSAGIKGRSGIGPGIGGPIGPPYGGPVGPIGGPIGPIGGGPIIGGGLVKGGGGGGGGGGTGGGGGGGGYGGGGGGGRR